MGSSPMLSSVLSVEPAWDSFSLSLCPLPHSHTLSPFKKNIASSPCRMMFGPHPTGIGGRKSPWEQLIILNREEYEIPPQLYSPLSTVGQGFLPLLFLWFHQNDLTVCFYWEIPWDSQWNKSRLCPSLPDSSISIVPTTLPLLSKLFVKAEVIIKWSQKNKQHPAWFCVKKQLSGNKMPFTFPGTIK